MVDFLSKYNLDSSTIEEMKKRDPGELFDLSCNEKEIKKIIDYLRSIGIENIDELLLYETELFFRTANFVEKKFSVYNIPVVVQRINDNYEEIEMIF